MLNYEGRIATYYWSVLAKIFNKLCPEFHLAKRGSKSYSWNMNASDEVDALLNYGYAVLESEIRKDINAIGLDPTIGFLHELAQSKTPLVYDIQELFRWLVDLSVLQMLEEKKLKKSDFIVTENYHSRLKPATAKKLIERISLNFNAAVNYKAKKHTYQNILFDNVRQLANVIVGKRKDFQQVIPLVKIQRFHWTREYIKNLK
ncbi:MAG TPA: CRISPR-associated endonuclease Cas1 [Nitrososphaera sp.]|nr:CRISPR-associated endonuclease Cas1 [Nitrososphaera sp.]